MAAPEAAQENLIKDINMDLVKKIRIPNEDNRMEKFERNHRYDFNVTLIENERIVKKADGTEQRIDIGDTIVLNDSSKNQKLTIRQVLAFYEDVNTMKDEKPWTHKEKTTPMLPYQKGTTVKKFLTDNDKPFPTGITFKERTVLQGSSKGYFEYGKEELRAAKENAYKGHEIDWEKLEEFPLLVPASRRKDTDLTDHKNWREATVTLVELHWD